MSNDRTRRPTSTTRSSPRPHSRRRRRSRWTAARQSPPFRARRKWSRCASTATSWIISRRRARLAGPDQRRAADLCEEVARIERTPSGAKAERHAAPPSQVARTGCARPPSARARPFGYEVRTLQSVAVRAGLSIAAIDHAAQHLAVGHAVARRLHREDDEHVLLRVDPEIGAARAAPIVVAGRAGVGDDAGVLAHARSRGRSRSPGRAGKAARARRRCRCDRTSCRRGSSGRDSACRRACRR